MIAWLIVVVALALVVGTWIGFRFSEISHQIDTDLRTYLVSLPMDEFDENRWYR